MTNTMVLPPKSKTINFRMDPRTLERLKALAQRQHVGVPSYLRRLINLAFERGQPNEAADDE